MYRGATIATEVQHANGVKFTILIYICFVGGGGPLSSPILHVVAPGRGDENRVRRAVVFHK